MSSCPGPGSGALTSSSVRRSTSPHARQMTALIDLLSPASRRERDRRGDHRLVADDARGVAFPRGVLDEPRVAGTEHLRGAVAETDLELTRHDDDELPARRRMPVEKTAHRPLAERDLRRRESLLPVRRLAEVDRLDVRLAIGPGVETE